MRTTSCVEALAESVARAVLAVPAVLAAKLDGTPVYRVVVGPTVPGREKYLHRRIAKMGLRDTWAIQVQPDDWSIASRVIEHAARVTPDKADHLMDALRHQALEIQS